MRKTERCCASSTTAGLSVRKIAAALALRIAQAGDYLSRLPPTAYLALSLSDAELERQLFHRPDQCQRNSDQCPTWRRLHTELRRPGVTLACSGRSTGWANRRAFQYSWFCEHYGRGLGAPRGGFFGEKQKW